MTAFQPGDGWREVSGTAEQPDLVEYIDGLPVRLWVREEPVPALPTAPYTVIRVTWAAAKEPGVLTLTAAHHWVSLGGDAYRHDFVAEQISGFEVLAEPHRDLGEYTQGAVDTMLRLARRETAKAVLDRLQDLRGLKYGDRDIQTVRDEFGVES